MNSEHKSIRFGNLLASEGTRNGLYKSKEFHGRGAKIVNMGELFAYPRLFNVKMKRVDIDSAEEQKFSLKAGDLLFARRSLVAEGAGKCSIVKEVEGATVFESSIIRARVDASKADSEYLYYTFSSVVGRNLLGTILRQTAVSGITGTDLVELEIPLPPVAEQQAIAHILCTLDDKIGLNRKTNETLEAMAKALFKSWFVDFDPVRAKAEGRPTGLPAEISDLFPDSFEDSELGEIPSGWKVKSAGKQYDVSIGKTPPRKESQWFSTSKVDMPWLSIRDLGEVGVYADRTSESLTREAVAKFNVKIVPPDTAVLSFKLTIGRVAITGSEMLTNEAITHFSSLTKGVGSEYTYCLLSQYDYHSLGSTSSIATAVNSQILRDMPLVVPPETIARAFCDTVAPIFSSIKCGQQENHCLSDFRDALLPKLISGEFRIPDAEKMLEEVGI
jgi:type I restriction enzyme S subunit